MAASSSAGGAVQGSTVSGATAGSASSGVGTTASTGSAACSIDVTVDNGATQHWGSVCANTYGATASNGPVGYFSYPDGGPPYAFYDLVVEGCAASAPNSAGVRLSASAAMSPGTFQIGQTSYTDATGTMWGAPGDSFTMTVTQAQPGTDSGFVDGTFEVAASHAGNPAHTLKGSFHACRVPDQRLP